jgi:hypothetical protein
MAIKNKRQQSTTASPAAPTSLNYGEIAIANDGTLYAGDKTNKAVSQVKFAETCDLAGNAVNASAADSAETATKDASGNTITTSYAAAMAVSGSDIQLKSKSGAVLSTITSPYATRAGLCNSIQIFNSNWIGTDGSVSAVYADANKSYLNLTASNGAGTAWPSISVSRINGHVLNMGYDGNLWISW